MIALFYGEDTYNSLQKLKKLKQEFFKKKDKKGFSVFSFEANDLTLDELRKSVLSQGLFSEKRLIIIKNFFSKKNIDKNIIEEIIKFLKGGDTKTNPIIFWDEKIEEKNLKKEEKKLFQILKKQKFSKEFCSLNSLSLKKWIKEHIKEQGLEIDYSSLNTLSVFSNNLWLLKNELDKLIAFKKEQKNNIITEQDIQTIFTPPLEENIWKLIDALGQKNKTKALKNLSDLIKQRVDFSKIISLLAHQYRTILRVKSYLQKNNVPNQYQLAKTLSLHPFVCQKAIIQERKYNLVELKKIYQQLLKIDILRKTKKIDSEVLLDLLIAKS